jgi:hypothetical protein
MVVEARDPVDPTGRNATCSHIGRYFFRIMSLPRPFIRYITPRPGQGFSTSARPHKGYPHCDQRESCDWRRAPMARPCSKRTGRCPRAGEWCLADPPCHSCLFGGWAKARTADKFTYSAAARAVPTRSANAGGHGARDEENDEHGSCVTSIAGPNGVAQLYER